MPLLNKKPLNLHRYNKRLEDDAEVFYCKSTNEIFEDYEEYCQRVILCNSLVWTCAITGKSNLTYEEAVASEENALKSIKDFPMELRTPILYLASKTERIGFNDFIDDVYNFVKDRYFLGESVEANINGEWAYAHVLQVLLPTEDEVNDYCRKNDVTPPIHSRPYPSPLYKYKIEVFDDDESEVAEIVLPAENIRRMKGLYTKDKNRVYLKQFAEQKKDTSFWGIQENILTKYSIHSIQFSRMFAGEPPIFLNVKKSPESNRLSQQSIKKFLVSRKSQSKTPTKPRLSDKKKLETGQMTVEGLQKEYDDTIDRVIQQARRDATRQEALEGKARKLEELKRKREERRLEKEKLAKFVLEWKRKRDDLECEDLKDFPPAVPVNCRIPNEYFGDAIMFMEFLTNFRNELKVKDYFPLGVKFDLIERALVDVEVAGPLSDILQMLLTALFSLQEQEEDEIRSTDYRQMEGLELDENDDITMGQAIRLATAAARWSTVYHGTPLSKLSLDAITVSEILRLHLLSSGGRAGDQNAKWRYQERGGYKSSDDPSLQLRMEEPQIFKFLAVRSVAELPIGDKVKVLGCLMNQILTYAELRDIIDERYEKVRTTKNELKNDQIAEAKREKEALAQKVKEKKEAKEMGLSVPAVTEEERLKGEKEANKKKAEFNKRLSELQNAAMESQILPLGRDRGYRKYWIFTTIGGLFIEDSETLQGSCLPHPTPKNRSEINLEEDTMAYVKKLFEEERNCGSDKENEGDSSLPISSPKKKHLGESNGVQVPISPKVKMIKEEELEEPPLVCTADPETCPVHGDKEKTPKWYFYYQENDIEELINCLNKRGIREHRLRKTLVEEKDRIVHKLGQCPVNQLNRHIKYVPKTVQNVTKYTRSYKGYENANLKYPSGTPIQEILELYIRELILDTEEKIYCGGLGVLKVGNRFKWREALLARTYDRQDDNLTWNQLGKEKNKVKIEDDQSRPDTPCSVDSNGDHDILASKMDQTQTVKDLASAVLQIARCIELKYLQKPLAPDEKKKEKSTPMERWESSLMSSTSFAQVYLHIATLENSVQWQKSALNARCKICRRGGDAVNMLLCDGCDRGFHVYCLKPKLTTIPEGDWFCRSCKPKEEPERKPKRSRRLFTEESDDEDNEPLISVKFRKNTTKRRLRRKSSDDSSDEPLSKLVKQSKRSSRHDSD
ncbi:UNVERIFIED_CONTAM: hypothetical protein PYX00_003449 [Menopon gallinae]|uniref:Bromodomain adjacent to zinc finger domain protein 1A n=1 Tax=Menopon gallinae TaxID=328185 RepID=A0AAW2I0C0_9NEOP